MLSSLKNKAIPILDDSRKLIVEFKSIELDFENKLSKEVLVDIKEAGLSGNNYYYRNDNPPYHKKINGSIQKLLLRYSYVEKLVKVNRKLRKKGLELYFYDCYRPIEVQNYLYYKWYPRHLEKTFPNMTENQRLIKRDQIIAKGPSSIKDVDMKTPPPHSTGGSADVTLRLINSKEPLYMGSIFDDISTIVCTDYFEKIKGKNPFTFSEEEAQKNRRILYWVMKDEGIENYPFEWWHFCWGDQIWAKLSDNKKAYYSFINIK